MPTVAARLFSRLAGSVGAPGMKRTIEEIDIGIAGFICGVIFGAFLAIVVIRFFLPLQ